MNPYQVVKDFEQALCDYTGAPYAVTTTSCTMALLLSCVLQKRFINHPATIITLPRFSYVSVPQSCVHAGYKVRFEDVDWEGGYQLKPLPIWDYARRFTSGMYEPGTYQCVSFHWGKILGIQQGGAILHDNPDADTILRRLRFDGRTEGVPPKDDHVILGYHAYMSPEIAAEGLMRLGLLPKDNPDLPKDDYADLSKLSKVFNARIN